jgi:hypothetical protein
VAWEACTKIASERPRPPSYRKSAKTRTGTPVDIMTNGKG